jgi:hypothetical protein
MPTKSATACASEGRPSGRASGTQGPSAQMTLAKNIVKWNLRPLEAVFNGAIRALA